MLSTTLKATNCQSDSHSQLWVKICNRFRESALFSFCSSQWSFNTNFGIFERFLNIQKWAEKILSKKCSLVLFLSPICSVLSFRFISTIQMIDKFSTCKIVLCPVIPPPMRYRRAPGKMSS